MTDQAEDQTNEQPGKTRQCKATSAHVSMPVPQIVHSYREKKGPHPMSNQWKPGEIYKHPDLMERHQQFVSQLTSLTDHELAERYTTEMRKLKILNRFGRESEQFQGYPNTAVMNRCRSELEHRSLPIPQVTVPDETENPS